MGVLQRFERRLGGLVEGAFAKVFKGGVEPVEIASALARETDDRQTVSSNRVLVPNEFSVELASGDFSRLAPYTRALCDELAEMVREHAAEQRYTFVGPVTVRLSEADDLDVGVFRIRSSVAAADPGMVTGRRPRSRPAPPGTPRLIITTKAAAGGPGGGEREYPLDAETTVIGRSVECDIRLNDTGVSRRHGEIRRLPDGQFLYVDAGSTNGSLVNGRPVTQVKLVNGDRIELGTAVLEFRREDARSAARAARESTPPPAPGYRTPPPDHRTPPPGYRTPAPGYRTPPPDDAYARPAPPDPRPEPGYRGGPPRDDPGYREGPAPRFRGEPPRNDPGYREGPAPRFRGEPPRNDPGYREGPAPRFRDDGPPPPRGRSGPPYPDDPRDRGYDPAGYRPRPPRGADQDPYRAGTDPRQHPAGRPARPAGRPEPGRGGTGPGRGAGRDNDALDILEPLDDVYDADTRLPGRTSSGRPGTDDRRRRNW